MKTSLDYPEIFALATVLQTAIVWIGISRHWKQNDLSAHTYVFARWLFPFTTTYQIVVHMHVVRASCRARVAYYAATCALAPHLVRCAAHLCFFDTRFGLAVSDSEYAHRT